MRYLLDTNACITYLNDRASSVARHLEVLAPSDVAVCSVVRAELLFGALRSRASESATAGVRAFLAPFQSVPFDDAAAEVYAAIRADLTGKGTLIGPNDLLIAATALSRHLILVTHNRREFGRVHGLAMEDWEVE
jgi:tRNA(fMet)-specific endonuclease VapC